MLCSNCMSQGVANETISGADPGFLKEGQNYKVHPTSSYRECSQKLASYSCFVLNTIHA